MSFWGFFKKKEKIVEEQPEINRGDYIGNCEHCGATMFKEDKTRKFDGRRYHTVCLRKVRKQAYQDFKKGKLQ